MGLVFVSWEIYGASPIFLGACTKYTSVRQGMVVDAECLANQGQKRTSILLLTKGPEMHMTEVKWVAEGSHFISVPSWPND